MKTTLVKFAAIIILSGLAAKFIWASDISPTPNLPDTLVIDFDADPSPNCVVIRFSGGHQLNITRGMDTSRKSDDSLYIRAGDNIETSSSKFQTVTIYPAGANAIRVSTDISSITMGELVKQGEEARKKYDEVEKNK